MKKSLALAAFIALTSSSFAAEIKSGIYQSGSCIYAVDNQGTQVSITTHKLWRSCRHEGETYVYTKNERGDYYLKSEKKNHLDAVLIPMSDEIFKIRRTDEKDYQKHIIEGIAYSPFSRGYGVLTLESRGEPIAVTDVIEDTYVRDENRRCPYVLTKGTKSATNKQGETIIEQTARIERVRTHNCSGNIAWNYVLNPKNGIYYNRKGDFFMRALPDNGIALSHSESALEYYSGTPESKTGVWFLEKRTEAANK